ncbi:MAG: phosphoadenosine phosphosulfate reductase [Planctomycetaceae bacterium]|nr:MAG: phosphoadenosine phosphosulfate reductase [Planctomycetaceae bacterium]
MARITQADLIPLNQAFEERSPTELLRWAYSVFGDRLAALSAMQMAGSVICHMISQQKLNIPVVFVDTGVNFQETLETRDRLAAEYGLEIITLRPRLTMEQQTAEYGVLYLTPEGQKQCCYMRKIEPLIAAKGRWDCFIGSLRRAEGGRRHHCPILAVDPQMNAIRLNPLVNMSDEEMEQYIVQHRVIVNPLHYQGYATIGCNRCTTPVLPTEPKRAGRWRHLGPWSVYCEINPTDVEGGTAVAVDLPQDVVDRLFGREVDFAI